MQRGPIAVTGLPQRCPRPTHTMQALLNQKGRGQGSSRGTTQRKKLLIDHWGNVQSWRSFIFTVPRRDGSRYWEKSWEHYHKPHAGLAFFLKQAINQTS